MDTYKLALLVVGVIVMAAAILPRCVAGRAVSYPIVYLAADAVLFSLPLGLPAADPLVHGDVVERLTEFAIIGAIMSCGLTIDLPFSWSLWRPTWRLPGVTMPLSDRPGGAAGVGVAGPASRRRTAPRRRARPDRSRARLRRAVARRCRRLDRRARVTASPVLDRLDRHRDGVRG